MHMLPFSSILLAFLFLHLELGSVFAKPGHLPRYYTKDASADNNIVNSRNLRYTVNVTIAGTTVNVILDTGSTDLWVQPPGGLSGSFENTGVPAKLSFGDGTNFVNGTVGLGLVEIAGMSIPQQAFLNVMNSNGEQADQGQGIFGIVGLGFDTGGGIPGALTAAGMNGTEVGKSVLSSIFDQNPANGRFFSLSFSRLGDLNDTADASLVISGFDDNFTPVQFAPILPQFPDNNGKWSVLTEGITVGGSDIEWTSFTTSLPQGQTVVLLDTGTTNFLLPAEIRDAIYSAVPGAVLAKSSRIANVQFSEDQDVWVIPCDTAVNMTTKFAGQEFPIHPLDLTDLQFLVGPDGNNHTVCVGSITNGGTILTGLGIDALYGDSFLRNVYSSFSFGNATTPPHIQLLADTVTAQAASDFANVRENILKNSPPELAPQDIINLFDGPASGSSSVAASSDALSSKAADGSSSNTDSTIAKYGPIIIGLLGANLMILLLVAVLAIMTFVRNGRSTGRARAAYQPVRFKEEVISAPYNTEY
ncbi:aspartic peptidase domain-containing protein [Mycena polygramma]|nr:aspartic peptidase domain-containing protein [Mycena polygramma]